MAERAGCAGTSDHRWQHPGTRCHPNRPAFADPLFFPSEEWREEGCCTGKRDVNQTVRLRVNNEIPAYRTGLVSALDVGTSKIVCVIGQAEGGSLKVLG